MADDNQNAKTAKKRGRPAKSKSAVVNEEKEMVTMSKSSTPRHIIEQEVTEVHDAPPAKITIKDINNRWQQIFSKYSTMNFDSIVSNYGNVLGKYTSNNPFIQNQRIKQINGSPSKLTKEDLNEAIANPEGHEQALRGMSWYLYYTNYVYYTLVQLNRNVPKYCWYATPQYLETGYNKEKLKADSIRIDKAIKKFNPAVTLKDITTQVTVEGKSSYLVRASYDKKDVNYLVLQKLNSNQVKITGFGSKQHYIASFNMAIFLQPGYSVEQYPTFIQQTWDDMLTSGVVVKNSKGKISLNPKAQLPANHILETTGNTYAYWVQLPQDLAWTFFEDGSHSNAFPSGISMFPDFESLDDYKWLQGSLASKGVNSIMTAEIPLAYQPKPGADMTAVSVDSVIGFSDLFNNNIGGNVLPFFAPFTNYKLHEIKTEPESLNIVYDRVRDLLATTANSALIPLSDKPSISSVQTARMLQEAKSDFLTKQYESFLNHIINDNLDLNYEWHITIHGGIFNFREDAKMCKELVLQGCKGLLPRLLSYYDYTLEDYRGCSEYVDLFNIEIKTDAQLSKEEQEKLEAKQVGRPALPEDSVTNDSTGASKDHGDDISENKTDTL